MFPRRASQPHEDPDNNAHAYSAAGGSSSGFDSADYYNTSQDQGGEYNQYPATAIPAQHSQNDPNSQHGGTPYPNTGYYSQPSQPGGHYGGQYGGPVPNQNYGATQYPGTANPSPNSQRDAHTASAYNRPVLPPMSEVLGNSSTPQNAYPPGQYPGPGASGLHQQYPSFNSHLAGSTYQGSAGQSGMQPWNSYSQRPAADLHSHTVGEAQAPHPSPTPRWTPRWTPREDRLLRLGLAKNYSFRHISENLLPARSSQSCAGRAVRSGVTWSEEEDSTLCDLGRQAQESWEQIASLLHNRTPEEAEARWEYLKWKIEREAHQAHASSRH